MKFGEVMAGGVNLREMQQALANYWSNQDKFPDMATLDPELVVTELAIIRANLLGEEIQIQQQSE